MEGSLLWTEIQNVLNNKIAKDTYSYEFSLVVDEQLYKCYDVDLYDVLCDYNSNICDYITTSFSVTSTDFHEVIINNKDNLFLETRIIINENDEDDEIIITERYKFIINLDYNPDGGKMNMLPIEEKAKLANVPINGQCLPYTAELLRNVSVGGIYTRVTVKEVIKYQIRNTLIKLKEDNHIEDTFVDMIKPNNERIYNNFIIPNDINILDLPSYIQNQDYGVYNGNIGTYLQRQNGIDKVFVYPLYNNREPNTDERELVILSIDNDKYSISDSTYYNTHDTLTIISDSDEKSKKNNENADLNTGSGFEIINVNGITTRPFKIVDDELILDINKYKTSLSKGTRRDTNEKVVNVEATENFYKVRSNMVRNEMILYQISWKNSNPYLLHPGMLVKYITTGVDDEIVYRRGVLQSHATIHDIPKDITNTTLNVMLNNTVEIMD